MSLYVCDCIGLHKYIISFQLEGYVPKIKKRFFSVLEALKIFNSNSNTLLDKAE
jgi:hypothetical protein